MGKKRITLRSFALTNIHEIVNERYRTLMNIEHYKSHK